MSGRDSLLFTMTCNLYSMLWNKQIPDSLSVSMLFCSLGHCQNTFTLNNKVWNLRKITIQSNFYTNEAIVSWCYSSTKGRFIVYVNQIFADTDTYIFNAATRSSIMVGEREITSFLSLDFTLCRGWRSWQLPAQTWKWEGNLPPSVLMLPTTQNLRLMGKYPPSQRRRRISNWPPDWPTKLPAVLTRSLTNESYRKQQQQYPPLHKRGNETNDSECYFCFVKKKRKKWKVIKWLCSLLLVCTNFE